MSPSSPVASAVGSSGGRRVHSLRRYASLPGESAPLHGEGRRPLNGLPRKGGGEPVPGASDNTDYV
jgi:hypothetical protein